MASEMASVPKLKLPPPFEEAVSRHEREIMRYLLRMTHDREDALDLFQETWLRAYRAYPRLDSEEGLRPWLFRIAANLCRNRARDRMRHARVMANEAGFNDDRGKWRELSGDGILHIRRVIAGLPSKQGRALMMRKIEGLDYAEIAAALKCSPESARAGVYQALKKLRAERF
jgi:RNA polymerase sigma-70 factor, ECF subfamily